MVLIAKSPPPELGYWHTGIQTYHAATMGNFYLCPFSDAKAKNKMDSGAVCCTGYAESETTVDEPSYRESFTKAIDATGDSLDDGELSGYEAGPEDDVVEDKRPRWWKSLAFPNPNLEDSWYNVSNPGFCESKGVATGIVMAIRTKDMVGKDGPNNKEEWKFTDGTQDRNGHKRHALKKVEEYVMEEAHGNDRCYSRHRKQGIRKRKKRANKGGVKPRILEFLRLDADGTRKRIGREFRVRGWLTSLPDEILSANTVFGE